MMRYKEAAILRRNKSVMKILYVTTIGSTMDFFKSFIRILINEGHTVDIATNEKEGEVSSYFRDMGCKVYPISCSRSPLKKGNLYAIKQIKDILIEERYDIVHCHTPIAASCTRIACSRLRKKDIKVIYTAHGFHFYKGAPLLNWLLYYPIEILCSRWTDALITINQEDYVLAKRKMRTQNVFYIPGVGIDVDKFTNTVIDRDKKRAEIGVPENAFLLLSVGELNKNKNHQIVIKALEKTGNKNIHYAIAGKGNNKEFLEQLAKQLGVSEQVHFLGYRNDVAELYKTADAYILPSIREGLNVSVMEALASGLLCIVSKIRGNVDMITDGVNGYYINPFDSSTVADSLNKTVAAPKNENISQHANKFNHVEINKKILAVYGLVTGNSI